MMQDNKLGIKVGVEFAPVRTGSHRLASVGRLVGLLVGCTVVDTVVGTGSMIDTGLHRVAPGLAPGGLVDYRIFGRFAPDRLAPVGIGWHRLHWPLAPVHARARTRSPAAAAARKLSKGRGQ